MIVIANKFGQLGNRLFIFANVIACAIENKLTVVNPCFEDYAPYFQTTSRDVFCHYPIRNYPVKSKIIAKFIYKFVKLFSKLCLKIQLPSITSIELNDYADEFILLDSPEFLSLLSRSRIIFLQGWSIRDRSNFIKYADKIRTYFTPIDNHQKNVMTLVTSIRESCDILIGVHIRQGDYKHFNEGKYFYSIDTYLLIMQQVKNLFSEDKIIFLICSNVQQEQDVFSEFNFTFANNHLIEDMYSLAKCDYIIGPPSTYTMWASFYGNVPLYMIGEPNLPITLDNFETWLSWHSRF